MSPETQRPKTKKEGEKTMIGALVITALAFGLMVTFAKVVRDPYLNGTIINGNTIRRS
tara:strand:- start:6 stop:179 length:174 start_codon:yes stop_codon:yes gene_type:complete